MAKGKHKFLWRILTAMILLVGISWLVSHFCLPKEIKLAVGKEQFFNFELPLKADINSAHSLLIKDAKDHELLGKHIDLNKPLSVTMLEQGQTKVTLSFMGVIPLRTVAVEAMPYERLIPCGEVVGIKIDTEGVLVLGVGEFESDHQVVSPCKGIIEVGDLITACNGHEVNNKEDFRELIEASEAGPVLLSIKHKGQEKQIKVSPLLSSTEHAYKIGLWIKDSTQGIGTVTFINPRTKAFGALGHGITDSQTHMLTPIKSGEIMEVAITHITKGEKGQPGELSGIIDYDLDSRLGAIKSNDSLGIFGKVEDIFEKKQIYEPVPIAFQNEVHEGKATLLIDLTGEGPKEYEVDIQKVSKFSNEPSKSMVLKIVDPRLLQLTHGIIQGMSGSPILQDGKLIGAVTHVFVHDPTRGYGIFIENMLNNEIN